MRKVDEKKLLLSIIGTIDALQNSAISIDESGAYLFSPGVISQLSNESCNQKIISLLEKCLILENLLSLIPEEYERQMDEIKKDAYAELIKYADCSDRYWGGLFQKNETDIIELFAMRGKQIIDIFEKNNNIVLVFDKLLSGSLNNSVLCELVFEGFWDAKQEIIFYCEESKDGKKQFFLDEFKQSFSTDLWQMNFVDAYVNHKCVAMDVEVETKRSNSLGFRAKVIIYSKKCHCNWL